MITESDIASWLNHISDDAVCGENLEYDPDYTLLIAKMQPKEDVQFGNFVESPDPLNWSDIEKETLRLLDRTRDINLVIILTRCWVRLHQGKGLLKGIKLLHGLLTRFPDELHPCLIIDGEHDPLVRGNSLASLADHQGLLSDVRDISLVKNSAWRLQVRDIERAFTNPRPPEALAPDSVLNQLQELLSKADNTTTALVFAVKALHELNDLLETSLAIDAPDLRPLLNALHVFTLPELTGFVFHNESVVLPMESQADVVQKETDDNSIIANTNLAPTISESNLMFDPVLTESVHTTTENILPTVDTLKPSMSVVHGVNFSSDPRIGRRQAVEELRRIRLWFEQYEPSSPIQILLKQAEQLVGKRFIDMAQNMPLEILQRWDQAEQSNNTF